MSNVIHLYRPQRTSAENLEAIFVAREPLLNDIIARFKIWQPGSSRQHYLIIGPRGIGKTILLRLVEHRIKQNSELNKKWKPIVFTEEAFSITKISDLLIESLKILSEETADSALLNAYQRVQYDDNDERAIDLSLDALRNYHKLNGCGILLMIENINRMFEGQMRKRDEIHILRKILIEEEWLVVICTSPTFLNAVTGPEEPLFEFFHVHPLTELTPDEQLQLLKKLAILEKNLSFENNILKYRSQLQALYHFTGGNPRLSIMLYDLIANQNITDVKSELDHLLDKLTPFYQERMQDIPEQESKLLEIMALMPEGCTPTELAKESRMRAKIVRALITRLEKAGYIRREERRLKKTVYIIPERFFRIWHQMNHSRAARGRVQYLLEFFSNWYATKEERDNVWNELTAEFQIEVKEDDDSRADDITEYMMYIAAVSEGQEKYAREFDRLRNITLVSSVDAIQQELAKLDNEYFSNGDYFFHKGYFLANDLRQHQAALQAFKKANEFIPDDVVVLFNQAVALDRLKRKPEASEVYDKTVELLTKRKGTSEARDRMLEILREDNNSRIVRLAASLLARTADLVIVSQIILILENSHLSWRRQHCATALGLLEAKDAESTLLNCLNDEANNVRGSAATALGRIGSEQAVKSLIDCLQDEAKNVRGSAAYALGQIGSEQAVQSLIECLHDQANDVRGSTAYALGKIGSEQAVQSLIECLKDKANNVRGSTAYALGQMGSEQAVQPLIECLKDEAKNVRGSAASALRRIGSDQAVQSLIECLHDQVNDVRNSAASALGRIGSEQAVQSLIECLHDQANDVRGSAASALGRIGSEQTVLPLIECLHDQANDVRGSAATALGRIGSEQAVHPLIECLKDKANNVRGSAATALGRIGSEQAVQSLIECLRDEDRINRGSAATALGRIGSEQAVQPLIECLHDDDRDVRGSAATALGRIGSEQAVQSLIDCLHDEAHNVRGSAATALGLIGSEQAVQSIIECLYDEANNVRGSAATALGRISSEQAVQPLIECLHDKAYDVRGSALAALGRIASAIPIPELVPVIKILVEQLIEGSRQQLESIIRILVRSAFRSANLEMIAEVIHVLTSILSDSDVICTPYLAAHEYLKSDRNPAILERQHPEMREAIQLLVELFDKGSD